MLASAGGSAAGHSGPLVRSNLAAVPFVGLRSLKIFLTAHAGQLQRARRAGSGNPGEGDDLQRQAAQLRRAEQGWSGCHQHVRHLEGVVFLRCRARPANIMVTTSKRVGIPTCERRMMRRPTHAGRWGRGCGPCTHPANGTQVTRSGWLSPRSYPGLSRGNPAGRVRQAAIGSWRPRVSISMWASAKCRMRIGTGSLRGFAGLYRAGKSPGGI